MARVVSPPSPTQDQIWQPSSAATEEPQLPRVHWGKEASSYWFVLVYWSTPAIKVYYYIKGTIVKAHNKDVHPDLGDDCICRELEPLVESLNQGLAHSGDRPLAF